MSIPNKRDWAKCEEIADRYNSEGLTMRKQIAIGLSEYRQELTDEIAALRAQRDELLEAANRHAFREGQLSEALKAYIDKYGPGYSSTDSLAYDNATGVLAAIASAEATP